MEPDGGDGPTHDDAETPTTSSPTWPGPPEPALPTDGPVPFAAPPFGGNPPPPGAAPTPFGPPGSGPAAFGPPPAYGPPSAGPPPFGAGGYGAPGYGAGPYPSGYGYGYGYAPPRNNNLAIASLIMGVLGLATCQLLGIGALITGYKARRQIRETGEQGSGMALAGIILGWVSVALLVAIVVGYGAIIIFALSSSSGSGSRTSSSVTLYRPPSTVLRPTSTTERVTPSTLVPTPSPTGSTPGPTAAPSGVIPAEACASVTLALKNLEAPEKNDRGIVTDAARTLHQYYPESSADDIDTVLADALSRVNRDTTGGRTTPVLDATQRLDAILTAACPG